MQLHAFGNLSDGRPVRSARLEWPGGLAVEVMEYGAAVRSLSVPVRGRRIETVLGFATLAEYEADRAYQGVVVGRYANRIANAAFAIDGEQFAVTANEGPNCLHGGRPGFDKRLWRFEAAEARSATLAYTSPHGEEGFPGTVEARATFTLSDAETLEIVWEARADRPTPVNLSQHLYFNLSGDPAQDLLDHEFSIRAEAITPVHEDLIPTGERLPVAGTPFDLRRPRPLREVLAQRHPQFAIAGGYDHNWVLDPGPGPAVRLRSPETDLTLTIATDQPGLQVYSGQGLKAPFAAHGGIALEPQNFPDAVNQPGFPDPILRPGTPYRRRAAYRFRAGA